MRLRWARFGVEGGCCFLQSETLKQWEVCLEMFSWSWVVSIKTHRSCLLQVAWRDDGVPSAWLWDLGALPLASHFFFFLFHSSACLFHLRTCRGRRYLLYSCSQRRTVEPRCQVDPQSFTEMVEVLYFCLTWLEMAMLISVGCCLWGGGLVAATNTTTQEKSFWKLLTR